MSRLLTLAHLRKSTLVLVLRYGFRSFFPNIFFVSKITFMEKVVRVASNFLNAVFVNGQ